MKKDGKEALAAWLSREKWGLLLLAAAALLFAAALLLLRTDAEEGERPADYAEYEKGVVTAVLTDSTVQDEASDGAWRGEQLLLVEVQSGQYAGKTLKVTNVVGPLYGVPLQVGDGASLIVNTYAGGDVRATVYEYNRIPALAALVVVFLLTAVLVGGKTGLKSLIGLAVTVLCLFWVLIPLLLRGAPTLPTVFLCCVYIAAVSFTILGGLHRKTVCAMLGTVAGVALALLFGLAAQSLARISGLRMSDVEPLLQLRQSGVPVGLRHLLVGGLTISALGAVMDVAMSISSALEEVHAANPGYGFRALFRSGMNIGRDMVGTMTNTLILAFLGSGFTLILYLSSLGLSRYQLLTSAYLAIELIGGLSSSIGMILAIPLTALISAFSLRPKPEA
ncbi:MAG: YibE/F family protein [Oscillospiraceae bacterium]|nr:YibE/F family protein [Oscillospiraceae bacterium]